jgi:hypothetical protein
VADVDVVEENVLGHRPELNADTANLVKGPSGHEVLEEVGVRDLARRPLALVSGVVDHRRVPLALVGRVGLVRPLPLAAARSLVALGVANHRSNPLTILLVIPLLRLLRVGIRDLLGLVVEPALGLRRLLVGDLVGSVLVPVLGLLRLRILDLLLVDPVLRLLVLGIINLLLRVDSRREVFKERAGRLALTIKEDLISLVRALDYVRKRTAAE